MPHSNSRSLVFSGLNSLNHFTWYTSTKKDFAPVNCRPLNLDYIFTFCQPLFVRNTAYTTASNASVYQAVLEVRAVCRKYKTGWISNCKAVGTIVWGKCTYKSIVHEGLWVNENNNVRYWSGVSWNLVPYNIMYHGDTNGNTAYWMLHNHNPRLWWMSTENRNGHVDPGSADWRKPYNLRK